MLQPCDIDDLSAVDLSHALLYLTSVMQILMEHPYSQEPQPREINALEGHSLPRPERRQTTVMIEVEDGGPTKSLFCNNRTISLVAYVIFCMVLILRYALMPNPTL